MGLSKDLFCKGLRELRTEQLLEGVGDRAEYIKHQYLSRAYFVEVLQRVLNQLGVKENRGVHNFAHLSIALLYLLEYYIVKYRSVQLQFIHGYLCVDLLLLQLEIKQQREHSNRVHNIQHVVICFNMHVPNSVDHD